MNQVIKLSATWCGPCTAYAPIFDAAIEKAGDSWEATSFDIDTEEGREIMIANNIRSVPSTIFYEFGRDAKVVTGSMSQEKLEGLLDI
tara:strand:- start:1342 stop:1605 length:264 start_codon:yes stop_codon:yes gene_type:complete